MPALTQDTQFEQTFSDLAFAILQDKSPTITDHILGFQVIDVNDDQTHAVGIFGAALGGELVYLPVFFLNGELKGTELMYLKNQDMFVPLEESWVNYVVNQKAPELGAAFEGDDKDIYGSPTISDLFDSPSQKFSSNFDWISKTKDGNKLKSMRVWSSSNRGPLFDGIQKISSTGVKDKKYEKLSSLTLINFLEKMGSEYAQGFIGSLLKNSQLCKNVSKFYSIDDFYKASFAKRSDYLGKGTNLKDVKIVSYKEIDRFGDLDLTPSERSKLLKGEIVIKDNRDNTSKVYDLSTDAAIHSPDETGIYRLITTDGKTPKCFVSNKVIDLEAKINASKRNDNSRDIISVEVSRDEKYADALVVNLDGRGYKRTAIGNIAGSLVDSGATIFTNDKLNSVDVGSMRKGQAYILVNYKGSATNLFYVKEGVKDNMGNKTYRCSFDTYYLKDELQPCDFYLTVVDDQYGDLKVINGSVFVPAGSFKALKVTVEKENEKEYDSDAYNLKCEFDANLCDGKSVEYALMTGDDIYPLKVYSTGAEFEVTVGDSEGQVKTSSFLDKRSTISYLCRSLGVHGDTAVELIKKAEASAYSRKPVRTIIKMASGYPQLTKKANPFLINQNSAAPAMNFDQGSGVDSYTGRPSTSDFSDSQVVDPYAADSYDHSGYNPDPALDEQLMQMMEQAAASGQKEVFDTALIGSLVDTVNSTDIVDKYVGDLILGLDRLGRIYFMYLQHNEDFAEAYGAEDMVELEDSLRNTFTSLGDLVMFMKQKSNSISKSIDGTQTVLGA